MSGRLPALKAKDVKRVLKQLGFYELRQKGSHLCFKHADGRFTLLPLHKGEDIGPGPSEADIARNKDKSRGVFEAFVSQFFAKDLRFITATQWLKKE